MFHTVDRFNRPGKAQYLSDGYFTLAILQHRLEASTAPRSTSVFPRRALKN
jgi:hypothetical protein